jgi:hypothetical protein
VPAHLQLGKISVTIFDRFENAPRLPNCAVAPPTNMDQMRAVEAHKLVEIFRPKPDKHRIAAGACDNDVEIFIRGTPDWLISTFADNRDMASVGAAQGLDVLSSTVLGSYSVHGKQFIAAVVTGGFWGERVGADEVMTFALP